MKELMLKMVENFHRYNTEDMAFQVFGLDRDITYDALVVAPSYTPQKVGLDADCQVTVLRESTCTSGYLVEKDGMKIAWIQVGTSDSNCIDHVAFAPS